MRVLPHDTPLIATIVAGLGLAFVFGLIAQRLRLPAIAGYLLAGVMIGPFTPASWPTASSPPNWPRSASSC